MPKPRPPTLVTRQGDTLYYKAETIRPFRRSRPEIRVYVKKWVTLQWKLLP